MFRIDSVTIEGFWGKYRAKVQFREDVNVLIGKNGSGKTTFMNLLEAVLKADLRRLSAIEFNVVIVRLKEGNRVRTIKVEKLDDEKSLFSRFPSVRFKIGTNSFSLPLIPPDYNRRMLHSSLQKEIDTLSSNLNDLIRVSSLSVHRSSLEYGEGVADRSERSTGNQSPVDARLNDLTQGLTTYQLVLSERAAEVSSVLQKEVLQSMLYDKNFDVFNYNQISVIDTDRQKIDLKNAYRELGALDENIESRINEHFVALNRSIERTKSDDTKVDDIMPLPLLRRTRHIIDLSRKAEAEKKKIFQPIRQFEDIVREFMDDKEVKIESNGELSIRRDGKIIPHRDLSSGEKQLLILLIETLLQRESPFLFLADEPELSLHIKWQSKIINSIKVLNKNSQVIVATHSPEVAGGWPDCIEDMEDIVHV